MAYAAWAIGNIAWASAHGCLTVVDAQGVTALVRLLESAPLDTEPHVMPLENEAEATVAPQ